MDDMGEENIESTTTYRGPWKDERGKAHNIVRERCNICGVILSETHYGCCGHGSSGYSSLYPHSCIVLRKGKQECKTEAGL